MTAQFQFFQSLPHKKADFVKKKPVELGVTHDLLELRSRPCWNADYADHADHVDYAEYAEYV